MPTKDEIFATVQKELVAALSVDEEEVKPDATITDDLGAESIDFLDILFRLEKVFEIKIPRDELFPESILTDAQYVQDGKLTALGIEELKKRMPFADLSDFIADPAIKNFKKLFTVKALCQYVESKVIPQD